MHFAITMERSVIPINEGRSFTVYIAPACLMLAIGGTPSISGR